MPEGEIGQDGNSGIFTRVFNSRLYFIKLHQVLTIESIHYSYSLCTWAVLKIVKLKIEYKKAYLPLFKISSSNALMHSSYPTFHPFKKCVLREVEK